MVPILVYHLSFSWLRCAGRKARFRVGRAPFYSSRLVSAEKKKKRVLKITCRLHHFPFPSPGATCFLYPSENDHGKDLLEQLPNREAKDENEGSGNATPSVVRKRHRKEDPFKPLEKKKKYSKNDSWRPRANSRGAAPQLCALTSRCGDPRGPVVFAACSGCMFAAKKIFVS